MKNHYDICIKGGLSRVGLPLGISLAEAGQKGNPSDVNLPAIEIVSKGKS